MKYLALGSRIRSIRERNKLTLEQVSERTGLSVSHLERIENDKDQPIIATLIQLSKALDVNVADIFRSRPSTSSHEVVRAKDREKIKPLLKPTKGLILDYTYEALTMPGNDKHMNAYLVEFPPKQGKRPSEDVTHAGEEFIFVLEGEIETEISGKKISLKIGDSLFFRSTEPHTFYNPHDKIAKAIAVVYPF